MFHIVLTGSDGSTRSGSSETASRTPITQRRARSKLSSSISMVSSTSVSMLIYIGRKTHRLSQMIRRIGKHIFKNVVDDYKLYVGGDFSQCTLTADQRRLEWILQQGQIIFDKREVEEDVVPGEYRVKSQAAIPTIWYQVRLASFKMSCNCPDYFYSGKFCKHIVAALLCELRKITLLTLQIRRRS